MNSNPTPVFIHYLQQLQQMLKKIEGYENRQTTLLQARLHANMLPFIQQVRTSANFALRACCPLAGVDVVSFENNHTSWQGLASQIEQTISYLQQLAAGDFNVGSTQQICEKAGFNQVSLPADDFLMLYTLPNFFFHLSMVYAIARQQGLPVGKGDFDGFHQYPEVFSFESQSK